MFRCWRHSVQYVRMHRKAQRQGEELRRARKANLLMQADQAISSGASRLFYQLVDKLAPKGRYRKFQLHEQRRVNSDSSRGAVHHAPTLYAGLQERSIAGSGLAGTERRRFLGSCRLSRTAGLLGQTSGPEGRRPWVRCGVCAQTWYSDSTGGASESAMEPGSSSATGSLG